jgi:hypothetical protein
METSDYICIYDDAEFSYLFYASSKVCLCKLHLHDLV